MLVALTGASGFIGSYTAKAMHGAGHRVRALFRATSRRDHIAPYVAEWREGAQLQAAIEEVRAFRRHARVARA